MAKRKVIVVDEEKCNGCGLCIPNCPEGALQIIDGKARLAGELLCDGLGACIGHCPQGAMTVEEREAEPYNEAKVMANVVRGGEAVIRAHLKHLKEHGQHNYLKEAELYLKEHNILLPPPEKGAQVPSGGCPGMMMRDLRAERKDAGKDTKTVNVQSELQQWPIQLGLLNPHAPYFKEADLVIAADCVPFSYGNFHQRFLKGKTLIMFCPKLDQTLDMYQEKIATILRDNAIKSVSVVHMEVPCCFGTVKLVEDAVRASGKNFTIKEYTISITGGIV